MLMMLCYAANMLAYAAAERSAAFDAMIWRAEDMPRCRRYVADAMPMRCC